MQRTLRHALTAVTTVGSAALLISSLSIGGTANAANAPGCLQLDCPTATGTTYYQYSDCAVTSHSVTAYGPYRVGWYLWNG